MPPIENRFSFDEQAPSLDVIIDEISKLTGLTINYHSADPFFGVEEFVLWISNISFSCEPDSTHEIQLTAYGISPQNIKVEGFWEQELTLYFATLICLENLGGEIEGQKFSRNLREKYGMILTENELHKRCIEKEKIVRRDRVIMKCLSPITWLLWLLFMPIFILACFLSILLFLLWKFIKKTIRGERTE